MSRSISQEDASDDNELLQCCFGEHSLCEPVLLPCLHNACTNCVSQARSRDPLESVTCTLCELTASVASLTGNSLLSGQVKLAALIRNEQRCDTPDCQNRGGSLESWCTRCCLFVCDECAREHRRACGGGGVAESYVSFIPLENRQGLYRLEEQLKQQCAQHRRMYEHFCLECERPKCGECFESCIKRSHELEDLECSESNRYVAQMWQEVEKFCSLADAKANVLQQQAELQSNLLASRKHRVYILKAAKRKAMDAVQKAYENCKAAVNDIYDQLDAKAALVHDAASRLRCTVRQAQRYSRRLLQDDGMAALLEQRSIVLSRLEELTKELQGVRSPWDADQLVSHDVAAPEKFTDEPKSWFGTPKLLTDNFFCDEVELLRHRCCNVSDQASARDITLPVACVDLAATSSGSLIVAAGSQGLREYDRSGDELSRWSPSPVGPATENGAAAPVVVIVPHVTAVDVLPDQRLIVGLSCAPFASILQRDPLEHRVPGVPGSWTEVCRIVALQAPCWQLAACGSLIAAAEARWNDGLRRLLPAPRVSLFWENRDDRPYFFRLELSYDVLSVAVLSSEVVTASDGRVKWSQSASRYLLDGYSHRGQRLWRCAVKEPVWDLSFARLTGSNVLYVALPRSGRVMALSAKSGRKVRDVINLVTDRESANDPNCRHPLRIARIFLNVGSSGSELLVLCKDSTTVRLYQCDTSAAVDTSASVMDAGVSEATNRDAATPRLGGKAD